MKKDLYFKSIFTFLITLLCHVGFGQETFKLVKTQNDLTINDEYIILGVKSNSLWALGVTQNTNNRVAVNTNITISSNSLPEEITLNNTSVQVMNIENGTDYSNYSIKPSTTTFLYGISGQNYLRTKNSLASDGIFDITINNSIASLKLLNVNERLIKLNSGSNLFSAYTGGQINVHLYKK